jgi:glutamyl/glutaminyl-tRNA synthetase
MYISSWYSVPAFTVLWIMERYSGEILYMVWMCSDYETKVTRIITGQDFLSCRELYIYIYMIYIVI